MGNICGIDIFKMLMEKYGEDFAKLIAIEKGKQFLDGKVTQLKGNISKETGKIKDQGFKEIDEQDGVLQTKFEEVKKDLPSVPGAESQLESAKKQFKDELATMKTSAGAKFDEEETKIMGQVDETKKSQFETLDKQKPQLPLFEQLPDEQKKQVMKKGEKQFAPQIKKQQDAMVSSMGDKLNPESYLGDFKNIIPSGDAKKKVDGAVEKFESVKKMLSGGSIENLF